MRPVSAPVQVACAPTGDPVSVRWGRRRFAVTAILDRWEAAGRWWEGESPRDLWRLATREGPVLEVRRADGESEWRLERTL